MVSAQTRPNKRPPTQEKRQAGKKVVVANSHGRPIAKGKEKEKPPRRSRPVTAPVADEEDEDEDEENDDELGDDQNIEDDNMEITEAVPKDPNASRESHKAQKELHAQRRAAKPHSALLTDAKRLWAQARRTDITSAERRKHVGALMDVVRGHVKDLVLKHDASRIIQTLVKRGTSKEREEIAGELKGQYKALAQSRYSKFLVAKLIRLCPTYRSSILAEFAGSVPRLLLHREAAGILADAFELHANAAERGILLRDFYGPEARLASFTPGSKEDTEQARKGLAGLLEGADPERRKRILGAVKSHLTSIFNNPDKGAVTHAIVHRVLWEYLAVINNESSESEQATLRRDIFDNCQDVLAEMVHTKDGSRSVREFIAHGSAKDRKHIIKALKPHIERMCTSDEAQLVLFSALDIIDDTKLTGKSLVADVVSYASSLVTSSQGRRALLYPLVGRTRRHLTPAQIAALSETDAIRATTSKKDDSVRADEIRKACSEGMLEWIAKDGASVARDTGGSLVVTDCLLYADGDKNSAIEALLKDAATPYPSEDLEHQHPLDLPHTSRLYKTLLQGGHYSQASRTVDVSANFSASAFVDAFVRIVGKDVVIASATGAGAFVVAALCERLVEDGSHPVTRNIVKDWFDGAERKKLEEWTGRGKAVLVEAVSKL